MVQALVTLGEHADRVLTIIRGKYGIKNKSDAVNFVIEHFEQEFLEPELRPEYVKKIQRIEKRGKFTHYKTLQQLRDELENA